MVKKLYYILFCIIIIACNHYKSLFPRNSCGSIRILNRNQNFDLNYVGANFYKVCDTASVYKYIGEYTRNSNNRLIFVNYNYNKFYKFYSEGKAGKFGILKDISITKEALNPCLATNSYYGIDKYNRIILRNYFISKTHGDYLNTYVLEFKNDTLKVTDILNKEYLEYYKREKLPQDWLIYKPDW